jgi:transcriptional regulator with XRE-family HTH domain
MIGSKIKELRKKRNMSLKDLSNKVDISISFLSDIENERSQPSLNRLVDLADGLETTIAYLLGEITLDLELIDLCHRSEIREILKQLKTIDQWSEQDIEELKTYLDIKNSIILNDET